MKYKFIILLFLWLGMIGYGCQSKSEQNKIVSEYSSLILDHIFLSEDFSLPPYYELKGKGGKVYRVDSIFNSLKLVIRFSELNCEKCYTEELERIMESGLSQMVMEKEAKVESTAIREMREEVKKLLDINK